MKKRNDLSVNTALDGEKTAETVQHGKALTTNPDNLNSTPRPHPIRRDMT